jgi:hypothetical protein
MDTNTYIIKRVGTAKMVGFLIGLIAFLVIPTIWPSESMWLRIGILLWYGTFGAFIGIIGLFNEHPVFKFRMPFWFRGLVFGAWLNLVLAFLMHDKLAVLIPQVGGVLTGFRNPFWIVLEGAVLGLLIDGIATRVAGEGMPAADRP